MKLLTPLTCAHFLTTCALPLAAAPAPSIQPTTPYSLTVRVGDKELTFAPPEIQVLEAKKKDALPEAPKDFAPVMDKREYWDGIGLTPGYDPTRTHILGSLFRTFRPETLVVMDEAGEKTYVRDQDFVFQEKWGIVANKEGRLQGKIRAQAEAALQRLDLIQADAQGVASVKQGESVLVCPQLPEPDAGHTALAGIYIAPWRAAVNPHFAEDAPELQGASEYAITPHEIHEIAPAQPVEILHPEHLAKTVAKLKAGEPVKIAFVGDSITLGAESTRWWQEDYDKHAYTFRGQVVKTLRERFPTSVIEPIEAFKGGVPIAYGIEHLEKTVLPGKPDLLLVAFGANDAFKYHADKAPTTSKEDFIAAHAKLAKSVQDQGGEVLYVTCFPINPWLSNGNAERLQEYIQAQKAAASEHGAAVADVNQAFLNLNTQGIPWWSQNHNWNNHPGNFGHKIYAETILRAFPQ